MAKYNKLIVAVAVPVVGLIFNWLGWDVEFGEEQVNSLLALLTPILTAAGVFVVPNTA